MKISDIQFLYPRMVFGGIALQPEIDALRNCGFVVDSIPHDNVSLILYKGFPFFCKTDYPTDKRMWQGWKEFQSMALLSRYYPLIADISIPTFFIEELNECEIKKGMAERHWESVFIKNDVKSLFAIDDTASVYPLHPLSEIQEHFLRYPRTEGSKYAIRKYVNADWVQEDRYFVINDQIFHRSGIIPSVVKEAVERLKPIGNHYYAIDAMPDFIVEINPGECSNRYGDNPPELFASWFKQALEKL